MGWLGWRVRIRRPSSWRSGEKPCEEFSGIAATREPGRIAFPRRNGRRVFGRLLSIGPTRKIRPIHGQRNIGVSWLLLDDVFLFGPDYTVASVVVD